MLHISVNEAIPNVNLISIKQLNMMILAVFLPRIIIDDAAQMAMVTT